ncbi:MAG: helix-turn-helix transcriptional regulator [Chlorobiaceae bacterium]|nr:helix-turn-helix transcriptional regulator [Chlorobiaceae bacterium]
MKLQTEKQLLASPRKTGTACDASASLGAWRDRSSAIARRVTMALQARNLMQKELAEMLGIKPQQVSRILKGNVNLTLETISRLESALGIGLLEVPADRLASPGGLPANIPGTASVPGPCLRRTKAPFKHPRPTQK